MRAALGPGSLVLKISCFVLLLAISCGGGSAGGCGAMSGCGGCGTSAYHYPINDPNRPDALAQRDIARIRITQRFLDFIRPQLPAVIRSALGQMRGMTIDANNVLHISIADQNLFNIGVASAQLRNAEALIWLNDLDQRLELRFEQPNSVHLRITHLRFGVRAKLKENVVGTHSSCPIEGNLGPLGPGPLRHAAEMSIEARIDPGVGPDPMRNLDIRTNVGSAMIDNLAVHVEPSSVYCQEPECRACALPEIAGFCPEPGGRCAHCNVFCGGITSGLLSLVSALINVVRPLLNQVLGPIVNNLLMSQLNALNGRSAKFETQVNIADLIGAGGAVKRSNPFGLLITPEPGRFPVNDRGTGLGMEITTTGGAEGRLADCVGDLRDFVPMKGPTPTLGGNDTRGRPYHLGVTIASSFLNQLFYAIHRSGSLCMRLGTEDVFKLSKGKFTMNAGLLSILSSSIGKLAPDRAPVILELKPRNPGKVVLGSGMRIGQDTMGRPTYDSLIKINLQELGIAFHVLMQDRYVRLFEVTADVNVGMNINVTRTNKLEVAIGELKIDNFQQYFNKVLPSTDFAMLLPTLVDIAMQALFSNSLNFDLDLTRTISDALGGAPIYMRVNEIVRDGAMMDYLTMTITMTSTPATMLSLIADTTAKLESDGGVIEREEIPDREARGLPTSARPTGYARLRVGEGLSYSHQRELEYQARVDEGLWRIFHAPEPDGTFWVDDPHLFVPGAHEIEIRARYFEDYLTLDPTPALVPVVVDPNPPSVEARVLDEHVVIKVVDLETPRNEPLTLQARLDRGPWFDVPLVRLDDEVGTAVARYPLTAIGQASRMTFRASDPRGNQSGVISVSVGLNAAIEPAPAAGGCACHDIAGVPHAHGEAERALLAIALLGVMRRRRGRE